MNRAGILNIVLLAFYVLLTIGSADGSSNWQGLGNSTYRYMSTNRSSFQDARASCNEFGGDLAQLKTHEINEFVDGLIGNQAVWIGLFDQEDECTYKWIDGSLLDSSLSSWEGNEAVLCQQYKDCIQLEQGTWRENNCSTPLYFVCERSGIYSNQLIDVHFLVSDPYGSYGAQDDPKTVVFVDKTETKIACSETVYEIGSYFPGYRIQTDVPTIAVSSLNSMSEVREVVSTFHAGSSMTECSVSSESVDTPTILTAIHLSPDNQGFRPSNGRFTVTAYPGTNIILNVTSSAAWYLFQERYPYPFQYGQSINVSSVNEEDEGIYVTCEDRCYGGFGGSLIQLIVYDCSNGRWGPPSCLGVCDPCYNGGICHDLSGSCICPPGFIGNNCLQACGEHRLGPECDIPCGVDQGLYVSCAGSQICRPDPFGCNCLSGYTGIYCNESCESGQYGVDCFQDCHCVGGSACDIYSGECPGDCQGGWSGPSCQVPDMCPDGFYGEHCLKKCHCLGYTSCDRETGSCDLSVGQCAFGYMTSPSMNVVCDVYTGCFDSCFKICHCSGGVADCNSVTGECFSGVCLSGWTGQTCQIESPKLVEPPTLFHKDCDTIAIIWNAWNRDRDSGEGPIGGYDIFFKSETSDWSKAVFVTYDSTTTNVLEVLSYVLTGLESDVEYTLSVAPVHVHDVNAGPMDVYSGQELVTRTLHCIAETTVTMEPDSLATERPFDRSGASVPWALFGITFVLLLICGGVLLGLRFYRRMTLTSTSPENASSVPVSSGTTASSPNDYLYENLTFSAEGSTPELTYQGLNEGAKIPGSKIPQSGAQDEYAEIQGNPSASVYEKNVVKVL